MKEEAIQQPGMLTEEMKLELTMEEQQESEAENSTEPESEIDILDMLTPEQYKELMESVKESDKGNVLTLEELRKEFEEWRTNFILANPSQRE